MVFHNESSTLMENVLVICTIINGCRRPMSTDISYILYCHT